jgi:hypothetical protein
VAMKNSIFQDTSCSPVKVNRCFGGTYHVHLKDRHVSRERKKHEASRAVFRNAGWLSPYYTASYHRRQNSTQTRPPEIKLSTKWRMNKYAFTSCERILSYANGTSGEMGLVTWRQRLSTAWAIPTKWITLWLTFPLSDRWKRNQP